MINNVLNYLHRKGYRKLLAFVCQIAYFLRGYGRVRASYHEDFRAYEYRVKGTSFLSPGPGWAYSHAYLNNILEQTFNFYYQPKPGDCIIDIGAGLGEEAVVYGALVGSKGVVHAIEANPTAYEALKYMLDENNFDWVKTHNLAVYKEDGKVTIEDNEENYLENTINKSNSGHKEMQVDARTLDTFVRENSIAKIDFLKSNIEGAEQHLIQGMSSSVKLIRNICISCHDFRHVLHDHGEFYMTKEKVLSFLKTNGFKVSTRNTGNSVIDDYIYAENTSLL